MASIRPLKIISGGQTGVDQIALELAEEYGLLTGGMMHKGWLTLEGPRPEFEQRFGMRECPVTGYPARTMLNVRDSHVTLWFGEDSRGRICTWKACKTLKKDFVHGDIVTIESLLRQLRLRAHMYEGDVGPMILNVAGTRYRNSRGGDAADPFLRKFIDWYRLWL